MKILDLILLSDNLRSVEYIREYDILVKTPIEKFNARIIIEDMSIGKEIIVQLDDCPYPIIEAKNSITAEVIRRGL